MKNDKWLKSRLTSSLFRLIEFKTTKERIKELYSCLRFLKSELEKNNLYVRSFEKNGKPSLIALPDEQTGFHPEIFLHGHIDVVEGDEDQFEPRLKDGKIVLNLFNKLIAKAEKNNMGDLTKRAKKK